MDATEYRYSEVNNDPTGSTYLLSAYPQSGSLFAEKDDLEYPGIVSRNQNRNRYFVSSLDAETIYRKTYDMEMKQC